MAAEADAMLAHSTPSLPSTSAALPVSLGSASASIGASLPIASTQAASIPIDSEAALSADMDFDSFGEFFDIFDANEPLPLVDEYSITPGDVQPKKVRS